MLEPWPTYANLKDATKRELDPANDIVDLAAFHQARHGSDALIILPAYAQTEYIYSGGQIQKVDAATYKDTPKAERVNVFDDAGAVYRHDLTRIFIEKRLAAITSDVAQAVHEQMGGKLLVIDALRTVDVGYLLGKTNPWSIESGLLAPPGGSAHNKAMAVDCLPFVPDERGVLKELDVGAHIDCIDMPLSHRNCRTIADKQVDNRLILERAFHRAAFKNDTLIVPLRKEFWDFRFPVDVLDLWAILESIARCIGDDVVLAKLLPILDDIQVLHDTGKRGEALERYPISYASFTEKWQNYFGDEAKQALLAKHIGAIRPPADEADVIFHEQYNVLYDADLSDEMQLTNSLLKSQF